MAITQVGTAASGTSTASPLSLTYPTGIQSGDVVVVVVEQRSGSGASITKPTGFTTILRTNATTSVGIESFRRVCDGSETGSTSWTLTGSGLTAAHISAWRGVDNTTPVDVSAGGTGNGSSVVAPDATTTVDSCLLLRAHGGRLNTGTGVSYTADGSTTEKTDANAGTSPNISLMVATETAGAAGAVGTRTATASATLTDFTGQTIALTVAGGTPATVAGVTADTTFAAPAGTITAAATVAGPVAAATFAAPVGSLSAQAVVAGPVADITFAAPAGVASAGGTATVAGPTAPFLLAAPAGAVSGAATVSGVTGGATLQALGGTVAAGVVVAGTVAAVLVAAPAGAVTMPMVPATVGVTTTQPGTVGVATTDPTTGATTTDRSDVGVSTFGGDP